MSTPVFRWIRIALTIAAVGAVGWAFAAAVEDAGQVPLPETSSFVGAGVCYLIGLVAATAGWAVLLRDRRFLDVVPGFATAQLAKYVPGSIWQGVGQVADAHRLGVGTGTASLAFLTQVSVQLLVAAAVSVLALLSPGLPLWLMIGVALGPLALLLIRPAALRGVVRGLSRLSSRVREDAIEVPEARALGQVALASLGAILALGIGFALLLPEARGPRELLGAAGVFALAWVVGFLVVPLPSGLGVREAVLVAGLAGLYGPADVLTASIVSRVVLIVVEALYAGVAQLARPALRTSS